MGDDSELEALEQLIDGALRAAYAGDLAAVEQAVTHLSILLNRPDDTITTIAPELRPLYDLRDEVFLHELDLAISKGAVDAVLIHKIVKTLETASTRLALIGRFPTLRVTVDLGDAAPEEVAELLADLSILYRRTGGSGINFSLSELHLLVPEET